MYDYIQIFILLIIMLNFLILVLHLSIELCIMFNIKYISISAYFG